LSYRDISFLLSALDFVRPIDGEKQLIWLVEQRVLLGRDAASALAREAIAATTSLSLITTGGDLSSGQGMMRGRVRQSVPDKWDWSVDLQKSSDDRNLAELSGGVSAFYADVGRELERLERVSAYEYLLGYQPAKPPQSDEYREINVRVHRRGADILYRHGVEPRPAATRNVDVRAILTDGRIRNAAESPFQYSAIPIRIAATRTGQGPAETLVVEVEIDPRRVMFESRQDARVATLDLAVMVADRERLLVQRRDRIESVAPRNEHRENIHWQTMFDLSSAADQVKVVVFDYASDRLGTASAHIR
jgi:hypothetical protein